MKISRVFAFVLAFAFIVSAAQAQLAFQTATDVAAGDGTTTLPSAEAAVPRHAPPCRLGP